MRRRLAVASAVAVFVALGAGAPHAVRLAGILVAYKAKQLCSGVFVTGRPVDVVLDELQIDDLAPLRHIDATIDPPARRVRAAWWGLLEREAVYRGDTGCAVVFDRPLEAADDPSTRPSRLEASVATVPAVTPTGASAPRLDEVLARAFEERDPERLRRTRAVVVAQGGQIIGERYAPGIGPDTPLIGWSMTKSVVNAIAGIMVGRGVWALDSSIPVPEWAAADDERRAITLDHLLRMSSGLRFDETAWTPLTDALHMLLAEPDMGAYAAAQPLEAPPATRWQYSNGTTNIIMRAVRALMRDDRAYRALPRAALFDPLAMTSATMETDASGTFVGSSFMYATARDWARFGMLYARDGVHDGVRILPEGWVAYSHAPAPADPQRRYGAHFWRTLPDEYGGTDPALPEEVFHAAGHQGQFVTIVPSRQLVVVRLGGTRYAGAWNQARFVWDVLDALDASRETRDTP